MKSFSSQISRKPPRLTLDGLRRALELYGNIALLRRSLTSNTTAFDTWRATNSADYQAFIERLTSEGFDPVDGLAIDGFYFTKPDHPSSRAERFKKLTQKDRPASSGHGPAHGQPLSQADGLLSKTGGSKAGRNKSPRHRKPRGKNGRFKPTSMPGSNEITLPATLRGLVGNVFPLPNQPWRNAQGAIQIAVIMADIVGQIRDGKIKADDPAVGEIMAVVEKQECLAAHMRAVDDLAASEGSTTPGPARPVFGAGLRRIGQPAVIDLTSDGPDLKPKPSRPSLWADLPSRQNPERPGRRAAQEK
ncbi:hypothetical protein CDD83_141 [Cordyceps sp. RAO-2017]|nr:hypothetical protein CDD83_141 [Cordyceps sp. RAO-2017]